MLTDRGSSDRASVHSISHIIGLTKDSNAPADDDSHTIDNTDNKIKKSHSVHFEMTEEDSDSVIGSQTTVTEVQSEKNHEEKAFTEVDGEKIGTFMIRSETDEFQQIHHSHTINICDVAGESIKWLTHRLGPLLTAKHLSKNLIRMLALCYLGEEQVVVLQDNGKFHACLNNIQVFISTGTTVSHVCITYAVVQI